MKRGPKKGAPNAGRPRRVLDDAQWIQFASLAEVGCSENQISGFFGVNRSVLNDMVRRKFGEAVAAQLAQRKEKGLAKLLAAQWKTAIEGNPTMQIWLGKIYLGQKDVQQLQHSGPDGKPIQTESTVHIYLPDNNRGPVQK